MEGLTVFNIEEAELLKKLFGEDYGRCELPDITNPTQKGFCYHSEGCKLEEFGSMSKLSLPSSNIDYRVLVEILNTAKYLNTIYLHDNNIDDIGATTISFALKDSLTHLCLSNNRISSSGFNSILNNLTNLKELDVSNNNILNLSEGYVRERLVELKILNIDDQTAPSKTQSPSINPQSEKPIDKEKIDPKYADAWNEKGNALYYLGKYDEAIKCYDKAIGIDPKYATSWNNKGCAYRMLGRNKEADDCYAEAERIKNQK